METVSIKRVTPHDLDQLQHISSQTFRESFSSYNTEENMRKYLAERFSHGKLAMELNNADVEFYFAQRGQEILGYIKINVGPSQTEMPNENALEVERIYVWRAFQGEKVGQRLLAKAFDIARQKKVDYVWLGVWEKNSGAIRFYQKHGFVAFDKHVFRLGDDEQTDIMMKLQLDGNEPQGRYR